MMSQLPERPNVLPVRLVVDLVLREELGKHLEVHTDLSTLVHHVVERDAGILRVASDVHYLEK